VEGLFGAPSQGPNLSGRGGKKRFLNQRGKIHGTDPRSDVREVEIREARPFCAIKETKLRRPWGKKKEGVKKR